MFVLILFFFLFDGSKSLNAVIDCKGNEHPGNWTCVQNEDNTLNVTFDCNLNTRKSHILWLWSHKFPTNMSGLIVKNCDELILEMKYESNDPLKSFSHLQVLNISKVKLIQEDRTHVRSRRESHYWNSFTHRPNFLLNIEYAEDEDESDFLDSDEDFYHILPKQRNLPRNAIFKDIGEMTVEALPLLAYDSFKREEIRLESLKFMNVTLAHLHKHFMLELTYNLKEFIMEKVTVLKAEPDAIQLVSLHNGEAMIKIVNSTFDLYLIQFFKCKVARLIVIGNSFKELKRGAFDCQANEFVFSDNRIESLLEIASFMPIHSLNIQSSIVNIHGNIFDYIGDNAFSGIVAPPLKVKSDKSRPRRIFNLSRNEFRIIGKEGLELAEKGTETFFDIYNVYDNAIDCSCRNIGWFYEIVEGRYKVQKDHSYVTWFNNKNPNRCLNIDNCTLNQVVYNFFELCEENYQCPMNVSADAGHFHATLIKSEQVWKSLIDGQKEMSDSLKKWLEVITAGEEGKKIVNGSKFSEGKNSLRFSSNEGTGGEQGKMLSLLTIIAVCNLIILILGCFIYFNYSKTLGFLNLPCGQRRLRYGGTEMESQMALSP